MKLYVRYVDDVLVIWKDKEKVEELAEEFTLMQYGLKLKRDQLSNMEIHYLDLQLHLQEGGIKMRIYRKPTYRPILITNWSNDLINYKKAAFWSLYKRVLSYCSSKEDLNKELKYILEIGLKHGYRKTFLTKVLNEVKKKMSNGGRSTEKSGGNGHSFIPVPYHLKNLGIMKKLEKRKKGPQRYLMYYEMRRTHLNNWNTKACIRFLLRICK